ncbi:MAG: hypothetical protein WKF77_16505 [Planctomycetaceae bacterium]
MVLHSCRPVSVSLRITQLRIALWIIFLPALLLNSLQDVCGDEPATAGQPELKVRMSPGGIGRHVADRWGMTKALVINESTKTQTALIVVTPPASGGLQYAKKLAVPAGAAFETAWPVRVGRVDTPTSDFEYLFFPVGAEDGLIHRGQHDEFIPTYSGLVAPNPMLGLTGFLFDADEPIEHIDATSNLLRLMSSTPRQEPNVISIKPADLSSHGECLEPLDQLTVTTSELLDHAGAIESTRAWLQRGGSLWIRLDRTGIDVTRALLDDALPLSVVGETTTNSVLLTLNPEHSQTRFSTREVERTFDEPIRYVRVVQEGGEVIWNIDGWPVAIQIPVGRGTAIVTTVDSSVFYLPHYKTREDAAALQPIPSGEIMQQMLFANRPEPVLRENSVTEQAAGVIGYRIPSRLTAVSLTLCFPALLLGVGVWLQRREKGERLIILLPLLAILVALPAVGIGSLGRRVAPNTVIETAFVQSVPGSKRLVSDGYASVFDFGSEALRVSGTEGTIVEVDPDPTNRNYRRLVWTGLETCHWEGLSHPDGIQTFSVRSLETLQHPISVTATFDENGVAGKLESGGLTETGDLIVAGMNPDRMSLRLDSAGQFYGTPQDVLAAGDFSGGKFVSDQQRRRAEIYASVFNNSERNEAFPQISSLLFWAQSNRQMLDIGGSDVRRERSLLVVHPLRMEQPKISTRITIPSPFISLRTTQDAEGLGFSAIFDNRTRQWSRTERSSRSFMEFQIPAVCLPFEVETAELELFIRAGSRTVTVSAGTFASQAVVSSLVSPLGAHSISVPVELIRESCREGKLYVSVNVSDLDEVRHDEDVSQTQNDYWEISRLGLTLTGQRTADVP